MRPQAILINEALARAHFQGDDPIGRDTDRGTIVGVVGDVRQARLDQPAIPEIYQGVSRDAGIASDLGLSLIVSTSGSPEAIVPAVRAAVREVNPILAIFNAKTMDRVLSDSLWELNLYRWLIGLFVVLALVLATIGLYGVISYGVTSRSREFAVRLALGSDPAGLARLVLARGARLVTIGLVLGAIGALSLTAAAQGAPGEHQSGRHDVCRDCFHRVRRAGHPRCRRESSHGASTRLSLGRGVIRAASDRCSRLHARGSSWTMIGGSSCHARLPR